MSNKNVEIWILVDTSGDSAVGDSAEAAAEKYEEDIQELKHTEGFRMVKVTVNVPLPTVAELRGTVPPPADGPAELLIEISAAQEAKA